MVKNQIKSVFATVFNTYCIIHYKIKQIFDNFVKTYYSVTIKIMNISAEVEGTPNLFGRGWIDYVRTNLDLMAVIMQDVIN